jgi:hypothetical protein
MGRRDDSWVLGIIALLMRPLAIVLARMPKGAVWVR